MPPIGNYEKPAEKSETKTVGTSKKPATPFTDMVDSIKDSAAQSVEANKKPAEKAKSWQEKLKEANIPLDKAHAIVDDMLTNGYYEDTMMLTKRISITLRSRSQGDYQRYLRALDMVSPRFNDEFIELQVRYFLAASIVRFGETEFNHPGPEATEKERADAFDERMDWLVGRPVHLISLLSHKLNKFDDMIQTVLSEGVVENF